MYTNSLNNSSVLYFELNKAKKKIRGHLIILFLMLNDNVIKMLKAVCEYLIGDYNYISINIFFFLIIKNHKCVLY